MKGFKAMIFPSMALNNISFEFVILDGEPLNPSFAQQKQPHLRSHKVNGWIKPQGKILQSGVTIISSNKVPIIAWLCEFSCIMFIPRCRMRLNGCDTSGRKNDSDIELKYNKCSLFIECDPIPLNRCSGIADFPLPHSAKCLQDKIRSLCRSLMWHILLNSAHCDMLNLSFWNYLAFWTLTEHLPFSVFPPHSHAGGEVYTHSTLQRSSGGHAIRFRDHDSGYTDSPVKLMRLTKGVSISLPSSPLLPRQADIVPSQSCVKFSGGFSWNTNKARSHYKKQRVTRSCASGNRCKK